MTEPQQKKLKLAFIGLGVMGYPMAGHLARAGHDVTVYNRTQAKAGKWVKEYGGRPAPTPRAAAQTAQIVFSCVGNDSDLRQVTLGSDGAFAGTKRGAIYADHSTVSANVSRELEQMARAGGFSYLDAPVSGGQAGAEKGILTIMVGGDAQAFATVQPVMAHYGRAVTLMGPPGCGQLTKMVNQITVVGLVQALAEGLNFAMRAGLDAKKVIEVISKGAAQSWQLENRGPTMVDDKYDFGFAVDWMRKDLQICLDEARRNGSLLPFTALVEQYYGKLQEKGYGRLDSSSLMKLLTDK
jgi:3-hydroxyisobutyrate dehydrogenase-like beta-hydroxyacid dehydrogenase